MRWGSLRGGRRRRLSQVAGHGEAGESPPTTPTPEETRRPLRRPEGVRPECRLRNYGPLTDLAPPEHPATRFFTHKKVNDHRRSFAYISYYPVTLKQSPALHTRVHPALAPISKEGAQSNAPNAAVGHTTIYAALMYHKDIPPGWVCYRCHPLHKMTPQITHNMHIAAIQETKLKDRHKTPKFPGYTPLRRERTTGERGEI